MKNIAIAIFFLTFGTMMTAQEVSPSKSRFRVNFLSSGIGGEFQITRNQTLSANLNFVPQFEYLRSGSTIGSTTYYIGLLPTLDAEYRFYLNQQKRSNRGHNTYNNSRFYLAPRVRYSTDWIKFGGKLRSPIYIDEIALGSLVGYQKTFNSNLRMSFNAEYDMEINRYEAAPSIMGNFNLSYALLPKKRR